MPHTFSGPFPVEWFFRDFFPVGDGDGTPSAPSPAFTDMANATSEREMHGFFINATSSLLTRFTAFDVSNVPSSEGEDQCYPTVTIHKREKGPPVSTIATFQTMETFVEFKHLDEDDPFPEEGGTLPLGAPNAFHPSLQRIASNFVRQQDHQFRTSMFAVGIFGKVARLFRCDRSGCQVTRGIDYSTEEGNRQLTEFFLRLDRMADDPEARGWDITVCDATEEEAENFSEAVQATLEGTLESGRMVTRGQKKVTGEMGARLHFRKLVEGAGDHSQYPRKKVSVLDGEVSRDYIVGGPISSSKALFGRTTRGFVAMSVDTKKLVFLKETWRFDVASLPPEDHWYKRLLSAKSRGGMKHIGAFSHGSDVYAKKQFIRCPDKKQRTLTHLYIKEISQKETVGLIHYRMVQPELYIPLSTFRDSKHLTSIMLDIAQALEHVHSADIFHNDLSFWNIMIDVKGNGRLIDFDIARLKHAQRSPGVGTLQFASTQRLLYPGRMYDVSDELESFFFVILYTGLHFIAHNMPVALNVKDIFDDTRYEANGRPIGGSGKLRMYLLDAHVILQQLQFEKSPPFADLIGELFLLFQSLAIVGVCLKNRREPWYQDAMNANKLRDFDVIIQLFKNAVERTDWPRESDKVEAGNYSPKGGAEGRHGPLVPKAPALVPPPALPKRGREGDEDGDQETPVKFPK